MKILWWIVGIIAAVIVIWWLAAGRTDEYSSGSPSPSVYITESPVVSGSVSPTVSPAPAAGATSGVGSSPTKTNATYTSLVTQYGTNRIQFDAGCQATPKVATFKAGTKVMFDNRSGDARTMLINGVSYKFAGYGYWIIPMTSPTLPKTFMIDCGSGQNTGTITIQK